MNIMDEVYVTGVDICCHDIAWSLLDNPLLATFSLNIIDIQYSCSTL